MQNMLVPRMCIIYRGISADHAFSFVFKRMTFQHPRWRKREISFSVCLCPFGEKYSWFISVYRFQYLIFHRVSRPVRRARSKHIVYKSSGDVVIGRQYSCYAELQYTGTTRQNVIIGTPLKDPALNRLVNSNRTKFGAVVKFPEQWVWMHR